MVADGALQQKLDTYLQVQTVWANAVANYKGNWVPTTVMGGASGGNSGNGANTLIDLLSAKTANDLALDMTLPNQK